MASEEWTPERLRALDRAVAEARGQVVAFDMPDGPDGPAYPWIYVAGDKEPLPPVSLGTRETFELMEEFAEVNVFSPPDPPEQRLWTVQWFFPGNDYPHETEGPTPAIAICLAYLAAKGVSFNG